MHRPVFRSQSYEPTIGHVARLGLLRGSAYAVEPLTVLEVIIQFSRKRSDFTFGAQFEKRIMVLAGRLQINLAVCGRRSWVRAIPLPRMFLKCRVLARFPLIGLNVAGHVVDLRRFLMQVVANAVPRENDPLRSNTFRVPPQQG